MRTPARPQHTSASSVMSLTHTAVSALHDHAVALTHMCPDLYGTAVHLRELSRVSHVPISSPSFWQGLWFAVGTKSVCISSWT